MASSPDSAPSPPSPPPPSDDASPPPSQNSPPPPSSGSPPPPSSGSPPPPSSSSPPPPQTDSSPPPPNSSPPPSPPPSSSSSSPPPPQQSSPPPPSSNNNNNNNKNNNNNNNNNGNKNNNDNNNNKNNNDNNNNGNKNNNDNNNQNSNDNSNKNNNDNNNTTSFSPPPPLSSSNPSSSGALPPPPPAHKSSTKSSPSHSNGSPSQSSGATDMLPIIVGVTAGVTALLILMLVMFFVVCSKKKKRRDHDQMQYYSDPGKGGNEYYSDTHYPNWHNSPQSMEVSKPPPQGGLVPPPPGAGMGWAAPPPPPPMMTSSEQSSNFSGPRHPPLPPPSPGISLGLSNSSFAYDELAAATNGFSQANLLGQGGFGYVHRGVLASGKVVAVKSLKSGSGQGEREFQAEVEIISRVHHRHLVSLVGYCIADGQRMLVYEFVPNGTLEYHLYGRDRPTMDWAARIRIALGSAKGLAYLHEDCHPRIIHRDIKAANILLDENFEAMVADFGLAKLSSDNYTHVSTRVMGTFGYLAPEYASSGKLTEKSDVFSYGVMLLELITGRRPVDTTNSYMEDSLVDWARPILTRALGDGNYDELVDPRLGNNYEPHEMARMVACAAASIRHSARRRPKMRQIARALEGDVSLEDLNDGARPGHSSTFNSSTGSSDYDTSSYNADMKKFRKMALESQDMASSEFGATSEYGLNPSSSSGDSSEMSRRPRH